MDFYQVGWNLAKAIYEAGQQSAPPDFARKKTTKPKPSAKPAGRSYTRGAGKKKDADSAPEPKSKSARKKKPKCVKGTECGMACIPKGRTCEPPKTSEVATNVAKYVKGEGTPKAQAQAQPKPDKPKPDKPKTPRKPSKPKPEKTPDPKRLTADSIAHSASSKAWAGAWKDADVPQDLLKVLTKIPHPEVQDAGKGHPYYRPDSNVIMMPDQPGDQYRQTGFRHEVGHFLDFSLGTSVQGKAEPSKEQQDWDAKVKQLGKQLGRGPINQEIKAKAKRTAILMPKEDLIREMQGSFDADEIRRSPKTELAARRDYERRLTQETKDQAARALQEGKIPELLSVVQSFQADGLPLSRPQSTAPALRRVSVSDTPDYVKKLEQDARMLNAEHKRYKGEDDRLRQQYEAAGGDYRAVATAAAEKAAQSNPALAAIKRILDETSPDPVSQYGRIFAPDGQPATRTALADILYNLESRGSDRLPKGTAEALFDLMGATTKNRVGQGHSARYYTEGNQGTNTGKGMQATEAFANLTHLHAYSADTRALAEYFAPSQYAAYKQVLAGAGK